MKDEADDVRRLRAEVCVFNKKLIDYLEVSIIRLTFAAEKNPPLDAKSLGQLLKSNLEITNPPLYDKYLGQASARGLYF